MMAVVVLKLSFSKERKIFFVIAGLKNEYIWFYEKKIIHRIHSTKKNVCHFHIIFQS